MSVHRDAKAFGRAAGVYDRARPDYPDGALDWLRTTLDLGPGRTVLDLAAGTGKLTAGLARARARVIAVEPSSGMLDRLRAALPEVEALEGTAEAIPLPDASVDAVTVAQAFHWFANDDALAEIQRVLRTEGRLALVWNRRDLDDPAQRAIDEVFTRYEPGDVPRHRHGAWRAAMEATERFEPLATFELRHEQLLDTDGVVDRVLSTSFIAALGDADRARVADEVRQAIAPFGDRVALPYVAELFAYRRRG